MPEISKTQNPSALVAFQPRPGSVSRRLRAPPSPTSPPRPAGTSERGAPTPAPSTKAAAGLGNGPAPVSAPEVRVDAHRSGLSAPGFGETLRDEVVTGINATHRDGGQRPPITIGPESLDHHAAPRQQPDQRRPRSLARTIIAPCVGHAPVMALGTVGQFGSIDVGDAHPLVAAADSVAVVDGWRKTQDGGGKKDGYARNPSAPALSRQWPRSSPEGPASMPASLGGRRCDSADARLSEESGLPPARAGRGRRGAPSPPRPRQPARSPVSSPLHISPWTRCRRQGRAQSPMRRPDG